MHSPLPDSSALEAGILEDAQPSRLSRVQENVRNLLRTSHFGSVTSSPTTPRTPTANRTFLPTNNTDINGLPTPPASPTHHRTPPLATAFRSPTAESMSSSSSSASSHDTTSLPPSPTANPAPASSLPPALGYRATLLRQMAHASALFNTRAVAALDHPDLSDPSLAVYVERKREGRRQRGAWVRSSRKGGRKRGRTREGVVEVGSSQCVLCVLAALLLSAVVATYVVLATTSGDITPTFHILFILGIILATIVFIHTVVRLFLVSHRSRERVVVIRSSSGTHRHRRRDHRPPRIMPPQPSNNTTSAYIPATPIPVHMPSDSEVRPDSREAEPTATIPRDDWDKDVEAVPNPPPAYGRWRGSVRANPDLLHWQVLPSPVGSEVHELPSPTYEEAMAAQRTGPPSYMTRESPERRVERSEGAEARAPAAAEVEVEMVEGAGIGLGL